MNLFRKPSILQLFFLSLLFGISLQWLIIQPELGVSVPISVTLFYLLFFWSNSRVPKKNIRMSLFLFACILLISFSFLFFTNSGIRGWDLIVLPFLVSFHVVLMTNHSNTPWYKWSFIRNVCSFFLHSFHYLGRYLMFGKRKIKKQLNPTHYQNIKMILFGTMVSVPLILVVSILLMSADMQFAKFLSRFPNWIFSFQWEEYVLRAVIGLFVGLFVFGFIQAVKQPKYRTHSIDCTPLKLNWNVFIAMTILISLNLLYVLFIFVQFHYFFAGSVQEGLSYAEYARRGFFELVIVTLINWSVLLSVISYVKTSSKGIKYFIKILLTCIVFASGVMLLSAFIRLMLYEQEYGFTTTRFLVHSFMIFLLLIFIYTLLRVWIEKLSLARFYFFSGIVSFTILNLINMDQMIVDQNMNRYKNTGKIDPYYLEALSGTGTIALVDLYEKDQNIPGLQAILQNEKQELERQDSSWQGYNIINAKAKKELRKFPLE